MTGITQEAIGENANKTLQGIKTVNLNSTMDFFYLWKR